MPFVGYRCSVAERQARRLGRGFRRLRQPVHFRSPRCGLAAFQDHHYAGDTVHGDLAVAADPSGRQEPFRIGAGQGEAGGQDRNVAAAQVRKHYSPGTAEKRTWQIGDPLFAVHRNFEGVLNCYIQAEVV